MHEESKVDRLAGRHACMHPHLSLFVSHGDGWRVDMGPNDDLGEVGLLQQRAEEGVGV